MYWVQGTGGLVHALSAKRGMKEEGELRTPVPWGLGFESRGDRLHPRVPMGEASSPRGSDPRADGRDRFQDHGRHEHTRETTAKRSSSTGSRASGRSQHGARGSSLAAHGHGGHGSDSSRRSDARGIGTGIHTTRGNRVFPMAHWARREHDATNGNIHAIRNARPQTAVALRAELPGPTGILSTAVPVPTGIFCWSAPTSTRGWKTRPHTIRGPRCQPISPRGRRSGNPTQVRIRRSADHPGWTHRTARRRAGRERQPAAGPRRATHGHVLADVSHERRGTTAGLRRRGTGTPGPDGTPAPEHGRAGYSDRPAKGQPERHLELQRLVR